MSKEQPLWHRMGFDPLYLALAKNIGYCGYPVSELAQRTKEIVKTHGATNVSRVLTEIASFVGNRVMLNERAKHCSWQTLGPEPHKRKAFYQGCAPENRPPGWDADPPFIPEREIDPITDGLRLLTWTDMTEMLQKARRIFATGKPEHQVELSKEQIPRVESEMVRRGMEIPAPPDTPAKKPKKEKELPKETPKEEPKEAPPATNGQAGKYVEENPFAKLSKKQLTTQLTFARSILEFNAPESPAGQQAKGMADQVESEMRRRGMEVPAEKATA